MLHSVLIAVHVGAGVAGLLAGPGAMAAALHGRRDTMIGRAYLAAVTVLTVTALGLVALDPGALWPFALLAVATQAAVAGARSIDARATHIRLVCGSYVSLVTALAVVRWGTVWAWAVPIVLGTILVEWAAVSTRPSPTARTSPRSPSPSPRP